MLDEALIVRPERLKDMNDITLNPNRVRTLMFCLPSTFLGFLIGSMIGSMLDKGEIVWSKIWPMLIGLVLGAILGVFLTPKRRLQVRLSDRTLSGPIRHRFFERIKEVDLLEIDLEKSRFGGFWGSRIRLSDGSQMGLSRVRYLKSEIDHLCAEIKKRINRQPHM